MGFDLKSTGMKMAGNMNFFTYAIIGTMCVESETCYEKYHEKKILLKNSDK